MREREDALRSMQRFAFNALGGPPWRTRLAMIGFRRPFALLNAPVPAADARVGAETVRDSLNLVMQLYPELPTPGPLRAVEARLVAERAAERMIRALRAGVPDLRDPTVHSWQNRIPLWDYHDATGAPLPLSGPESIATRRNAPDYLLVDEGWTVHVQPEAGEDQLFVALVNVRVQWLRSARPITRPGVDGPLLERVEIDTGSA